MRLAKRQIFLPIVLVVLGLANIPFHAADAAEASPELRAVIAAAQKEGALKVTWATTILGGAQGARSIEQGMSKMFGTHIPVRYSSGPDLIQLGSQVSTEAKAGRPASTDLLVGVHQVLPTLVDNEQLTPVEWQKLLPGRITDEMVEEHGTLVKFASLPYGITYNTSLLSSPPKTVRSLLDPQFKGRIATTAYAGGFDLLAADDVLGPQKALDFVRQFSGQVGGLIRCTDNPRIASGEFAAFAFDCGPDALRLKEQGLPIDEIIPRDFLLVTFYYLAIPINSQHPAAAKLLAAYLLTEEGQRLSWDTWREDLHLLPGSHIQARIAEAEKDGAKPTQATMDWYKQHKEVDATRSQMVTTLRSRQ